MFLDHVVLLMVLWMDGQFNRVAKREEFWNASQLAMLQESFLPLLPRLYFVAIGRCNVKQPIAVKRLLTFITLIELPTETLTRGMDCSKINKIDIFETSCTISEVGIYKRKQESKKKRKKELDQESDQDKKENKEEKKNSTKKAIKKTRKRPRKKEKTLFFSWSLSWSSFCFLPCFFFSFINPHLGFFKMV